MEEAIAASVWPVELIPAQEGGYIVNFPDSSYGWSQGEDRAEDLAHLAANEAVALTLRCVSENIPVAFLNHLAAVDRLSSAHEKIDVAAASCP